MRITIYGLIKTYVLTTIIAILCAIFFGGCSDSSFIGVNPATVCKPLDVNNGVKFECQDGSSYIVNDGDNGTDGTDGQDGKDAENAYIIGAIKVCPDSSNHDEILLVTRDGQFLSYFAKNGSALNSRLTFLEEGVLYKSTDDQSCKFKIVNGGIKYE